VAYTVDAAFTQYYDNINLSGDFRALASARRDHIFNLLGNRFHVVDAFAGGSIPKYTALMNHADLDIFVVLHYQKHCEGKRPSQVLQDMRIALAAKPGVRRNGQAVTLTYASFPDVDVVPVFFTSHDGMRYADSLFLNVPDMNTETWIRSMPQAHAGKIEAAATDLGANFRRVIKFVKHWNWKHGDLLRSFHIETLALATLDSTKLTDLPWAMCMFFKDISDSILMPFYYEGDRIDEYITISDRLNLNAKLKLAKDQSNAAWVSGYLGMNEDAINKWYRIFGNEFPTYG